MKKFQKTAPSSENDNSDNSSYETADIRLRNQSPFPGDSQGKITKILYYIII